LLNDLSRTLVEEFFVSNLDLPLSNACLPDQLRYTEWDEGLWEEGLTACFGDEDGLVVTNAEGSKKAKIRLHLYILKYSLVCKHLAN